MKRMKRWNKSLSSAVIGLFLVGCSLITVQGSPAERAWDTPRLPGVQSLRPGLTPVTVDGIGRAEATIQWRSTWPGRSHVLYGHSPRLVPAEATQTPGTHERSVKLSKLKPNTRYYFQVETRTDLGVARSAVLSFRTR